MDKFQITKTQWEEMGKQAGWLDRFRKDKETPTVPGERKLLYIHEKLFKTVKQQEADMLSESNQATPARLQLWMNNTLKAIDEYIDRWVPQHERQEYKNLFLNAQESLENLKKQTDEVFAEYQSANEEQKPFARKKLEGVLRTYLRVFKDYYANFLDRVGKHEWITKG